MRDTFYDDFSSSIVVFFVALPLCLGIALASGAPLFSGMISGIVGGVVVGLASRSQVGVSGPAAGLVVIVLSAITSLGSWPAFLTAVCIAGCMQVAMGYLRMGFIAYFVPNSVIRGMLTGIGLLIIFKQIPHAIGYDINSTGEFSFFEKTGETTFTTLYNAFAAFNPGATVIAIASLATLIIWDTVLVKKHKFFELLSGPLVVVFLGVILNALFKMSASDLAIQPEHLVSLPAVSHISEMGKLLTFPDFSVLSNPYVWKVALILAIVASLETLLCVEATDKLDAQKRITPTNRELKAQGLGNIICGLIGGLPVTQVIIRSSANVAFGAKTKLSAILHGILLLVSVATIVDYLNLIPLASLAVILIAVGYKLARPMLFQQMYSQGDEQFVPFMATIAAILFTDLLTGIIIGLAFGLFYTLRHSYYNAYYMIDSVTPINDHDSHHIVLAEEVSFFNKGNIIDVLRSIPNKSKVVVDCTNTKAIAHDVLELLQDFRETAKSKQIQFEVVGLSSEIVNPGQVRGSSHENTNQRSTRFYHPRNGNRVAARGQ